MADSIAAHGYYDDAVTEYYRFIFFHSDYDDIGDVYSKTAFCHAEIGRWESAIHDIDLAICHARDDSLRYHYLTDRAVVLAASGDLDKSYSLLNTIYTETKYPGIRSRAADLLLLISILQCDWPEAERIVQNTDLDENSKNEINEILQKASNTPYKSPGKAMILSTMLPGAGQFYAGRYLSGLNALILNGALAYATGNLLLNERYGYALLTFYFGLRRYFEGNRNNAYLMAREYNIRKDEAFKKELIELLTKKNTTDTLSIK